MDFFGDHRGSRKATVEIQLRGPRPPALAVNRSLAAIKKPVGRPRDQSSPVVVYLQSPKVIHVRPEEFMEMVQLLTGNRSASAAGSSNRSVPSSSDDCGSSSQSFCINFQAC